MAVSQQKAASIFANSLRTRTAVLVSLVTLAGVLTMASTGHAQTLTVLHTFSGPDGANPIAGLTIDSGGNLYGTTGFGGNTGGPCQRTGCGTVFKLTHFGSGWVLSTLLRFNGQNGGDGLVPMGTVSFGPDGALYGTTSCCSGGTVFRLQPSAHRCASRSCPWTETVINRFGYSNGSIPIGDLAFDGGGNLYGTTSSGGNYQRCGGLGCGEVYQLVRSGGTWTENVLYEFLNGADGEYPNSGVTVDQAGNIYGTAPQDGNAFGLVFELAPSGSGWNFNAVYRFQNGADGEHPWGGLVLGGSGSLYGTTTVGGLGGGGTVFQLARSGNDWSFDLLYGLTGNNSNLDGPWGKLIMDTAGNVYGTSLKNGAFGYGNVFRLSPSMGSWTYTSLHDFTGGSDGASPYGGLVVDSSGNLYGTAMSGGNAGPCDTGYCGVIWEITP